MRSITANRYIVLVFVVVPFLATLFAIWLLWERAVHWSDLILLVSGYTLVTLGVGMDFHRMLTHRSFRPHPVVKVLLLILGSMRWRDLPWNGRRRISNTMPMPIRRVIPIARLRASSTRILAGCCTIFPMIRRSIAAI